MKILILIGLISIPVFAATKPAEKTIMLETVRSIDYDDGEASVTFWGTNHVYRMPENASVMPCLWNGMKAKKKVALEMNEDAKFIKDCKL